MHEDAKNASGNAHGDNLAARLNRKRALARVVLFAESILPKLLPLLLLAASLLALTWFGYFRLVPAWLHVATLAGFGLGFLLLVARLRHAVWPQVNRADRMLEERNDLVHQAIQVQADRPVRGGPVADALWREHQARMARLIGALQAGFPRPDIARHDRHGLRAIPLLLLAVAFAFSYSNRAGLLVDIVTVREPAEDKPDIRIDAWVTPPAYTGRAPIFLTGTAEPVDGPLRVPQFSELTVRITGGGGNDAVSYAPAGEKPITIRPEEPKKEADKAVADDTKPETPAATPPGPTTLRYKIVEDGTLSLDGRRWAVTVIPDRVPEIAFNGLARNTAASALEVSFIAKDDYGIQEAHAEIVPVDPPAKDARPLYPPPEYRLDLPRRNARDAKATTSRNLTEHPLAGKRLRITLVARDAAGQEGRSQPQDMILPAKVFFEPLAAAVAEQRQTFALDANQLPRAITLSEALMVRPEEIVPNLTHFLLIKSAQERMKLARNDDQLRETAAYLWEIALGIEDGNLSLADRRLREAQQALSDALERNAPDEEIAKLMQELREAMQAYMQELARQAEKNGKMQQNAQQGQMLRQQDLERMMDQIENLARSGAKDQARQLLAEMQRMLNNLQAGRQPQQQQSQQSDAMREQMDKLGRLMQDQQKLMDQTFNYDQAMRERMQLGEPLPGEDELFNEPGDEGRAQQPGDSPTDRMTEEELRQALKDLKAQQDALGKQLGELQKGLREMGVDPGKGFGDAGREMKGASDSLGKGEGEPAVGSQGRALEALRQGAQDMMNQMQAMGPGGQGEGQPQMSRTGRDPLGRERPDSAQGPDYDGRTRVPEEIDIQRAREILDEIRRRLGTGNAPVMERNYLERLLGIN